jgi:flagellar biosynthesis/type III secretory pathway protein FliH
MDEDDYDQGYEAGYSEGRDIGWEEGVEFGQENGEEEAYGNAVSLIRELHRSYAKSAEDSSDGQSRQTFAMMAEDCKILVAKLVKLSEGSEDI